MTDHQQTSAIDWPAVDACFQRYRDSVRKVLDDEFGGSEAGVIRELVHWLDQGELAAMYDLPPILRCETGFPISRGRIDLLLFHADGSGTVIACKAGRASKDILPAVGEVMSQGIAISGAGVFHKVRLAIASRASAADLKPIAPVLKRCGVEPIFCGMTDQLAAGMADLMRSRLGPILGETEQVQR
ncbi:hypothetical protein [Lichenibacterium dinghuense]|uniref:hypothetical protein n=1 Tax=Lichenibacterium dinghuense TaxID=2895977 RepID=UPI001F1B6658|nr:hypothetical protein [Lichenibacterium sp. 6Y81]